jgi:hypothetical protein
MPFVTCLLLILAGFLWAKSYRLINIDNIFAAGAFDEDKHWLVFIPVGATIATAWLLTRLLGCDFILPFLFVSFFMLHWVYRRYRLSKNDQSRAQ